MLVIKIKGPDKTSASLDKAQFDIVQGVIISMMNGELTKQVAEDTIILKLEKAGLPLQFN
jgi:hypothetical protein